MTNHSGNGNSDGAAIDELTLADRLDESDGASRRGHSNSVDLGLAACRMMRNAEAELLALAPQRAALTDPIEGARLEVAIKVGIAWLERATQEFVRIEATMDRATRQKLWDAISQMPEP